MTPAPADQGTAFKRCCRNAGNHDGTGRHRYFQGVAVPDDDRPRLLFVCSRNRIRSLTAERLLRRSPRCEVRSVGTAASARVRVRREDVLWADVVYAMEHTHVAQLRQQFHTELAEVDLVCLDIPDEYRYMAPDLIEALAPIVDAYRGRKPKTGVAYRGHAPRTNAPPHGSIHRFVAALHR